MADLEGFRVICSTCGGKLRVRDRKLIGQIVACPKCQGMVLVQAPGRVDSPDETAVANAPHGNPRGFAPHSEVPSQLVVGEGSVDSEAVTQPGGLEADLDRILEGLQNAPPTPQVGNWSPGTSNPVPPPSSEPILPTTALPPVAWESAGGARRRQLFGIITLLAITTTLAVATFFAVVRSWRNAQQTAAMEGPPPAVTPETAAPESPAPATPTPDTSAPDTPAPGSPEPSPDRAAVPAEKPGAGPEAPPRGTEPPVGRDPGDSKPPENAGDGPLDPLSTPGPPAPADEDQRGTATELPEGLSQYVQQLQLSQPSAIAAKNPLPPPPTLEELKVRMPQLEVAMSEHPLAAPRVDVRKQMGAKIMGFEAVDKPLDKIVEILSQVAMCPIEIDLLGADVVGLSPGKRVSVSGRELEVVQVLRRAAEAGGFGLGIREGVAMVVPGTAATSQVLTAAFDLRDLGDDVPLGEAELEGLIGPLEEDLKIEFQGPVVLIDGPPRAKFRAALVFEAIRLGRQLPGRLAPVAAERWIYRWSPAEAAEGPAVNGDLEGLAAWKQVPAGKVLYNADQAEPIERIVRRLAEEVDASLVVDWTSAWEHGLTPASRVLPWYQGRDRTDILREILQLNALVVRDAGQGVWWLGSEEAYEKMPVFAILALPEAIDADAATDAVAAAAGQPREELGTWFDAGSRTLLLALPRYVVRGLPATFRTAGLLTPQPSSP